MPTLHGLVRAVQAEVAAWRAQIQGSQAENAALLTQVDTLSSRLGQNSHNSSRPPSSDRPWRFRPQQPLSGKKRGAQPGHPGRSRRWAPPETITHHQDVVPDRSAQCGAPVVPGPPRRPRCRRHQVVEWPPIQLEIIEYGPHARDCPHCRRRTWAALPPGVPCRCVGPRFQALAALLCGARRLAHRTVQRLLRSRSVHLCGLRGLPPSIGQVAAD